MPTLRDVQRRFSAAMFQGGTEGLDAHIAESGVSAVGRLHVYRESVLGNLTSALSQVYPVVERLLGKQFFAGIARRFVRDHRSTSGDLHGFGEPFADFLEGFPSTAELEYLPDVARLEWHCHQVFHAANRQPLSLDKLAGVSSAHYPALRFTLHPACRLLSSPYPVQRIWEVNQPGYRGDQSVDLSTGDAHLLVTREAAKVELHSLGEGEFVLLYALAARKNLGQATELAEAAQTDFELGACLQYHIARATLVDFHL